MPSLSRVDDRFEIPLKIVEGGSGTFGGVITEPDQSGKGSNMNYPGRVLRVSVHMPIRAGMVIETPGGQFYMVGLNGESTGIFTSYRLLEATKTFSWQTRTKRVDPVTRLQTDAGLTEPVMIFGAYEPKQETFDRTFHANFETGQLVTAAAVKRDDMVDGRRVSRVDRQLGLYVLTLG